MRIHATLPFLALILAVAAPAVSEGKGFEFKGLKLGMTLKQAQTAMKNGGWTVTSYTTVDGRIFSNVIDYRGVPTFDTLTDVITLNTANARLGCLDGTTCADFDDVYLHFRFGVLRAIEILSPLDFAPTLRTFAKVVVPLLDKAIARGDRTQAEVEAFFKTYDPQTADYNKPSEIAHWTRPETVDGAQLPVSAVLVLARGMNNPEMEKFIFDDSRGQMPWARAVCKVRISQMPKAIDEKWTALRTSYEAARAASATGTPRH